MKDIFDNELALGDEVAFYYSSWHCLRKGIVIKFNAKTVTILFDHPRLEYYYDQNNKVAQSDVEWAEKSYKDQKQHVHPINCAKKF